LSPIVFAGYVASASFSQFRPNLDGFSPGDYELMCVLPNRAQSIVPMVINSGSKLGDQRSQLSIVHDPRSEAGRMKFVLYATGEFLVGGKDLHQLFRPRNWGRLAYGQDLTDLKIELEDVTKKRWPDDSNDASQASRK
jgi:hypothetical protein